MKLYTITDKNLNVLKNLISNDAYFYEIKENAETFLKNLLNTNLIEKDTLKTNINDLDKDTLKITEVNFLLEEVKKQVKNGKEKTTIERENKVYAIFDKETNSYMQSFVVSNIIQAKRNLEVAKKNLKETCGNAEFIDKLELKELKDYDD